MRRIISVLSVLLSLNCIADGLSAQETRRRAQSGQANGFQLEQNYPNPFNPATTISFALAKDSHVKLTVFDILGRTVVELIDGTKPAGNHKVIFDANDLSSGLYLYRLETGQYKQVRKMLLVR